MVWPYFPFSEAFEHAAACAVAVAASIRQATAASVVLQNFPLQNQIFICVSSNLDFLGPKTSVVPFERQNGVTWHDWQWSRSDDSLLFL
jgi:hypothetical protein